MSGILSNPFVIGIIGIILSAAVGQLVKYLLEHLTGKVITIPQVLIFALILGVILFFYVLTSNENKTLSTINPQITLLDTSTAIPPPGAVKITIITPSDNDYVDQRTNVQYKIDGRIPNGYKHYILVQDPLGQYWSWGASLDFEQNIQIGEPQDKGKTFEIGIIVTNEDIQINKAYAVRPINYEYKSIKVIRK